MQQVSELTFAQTYTHTIISIFVVGYTQVKTNFCVSLCNLILYKYVLTKEMHYISQAKCKNTLMNARKMQFQLPLFSRPYTISSISTICPATAMSLYRNYNPSQIDSRKNRQSLTKQTTA